MAETSLESVDFRHKFGPGHVGVPDMIPRHYHHGAQTCCHHPRGPDEARDGCREKMAEADGSRRKLPKAEKWQKRH